jgi:hypothetical protein
MSTFGRILKGRESLNNGERIKDSRPALSQPLVLSAGLALRGAGFTGAFRGGLHKKLMKMRGLRQSRNVPFGFPRLAGAVEQVIG